MTAPLPLPTDDWTGWLAHRVDDELAALEHSVAALRDASDRSALEILELWNDGDVALRNADSVASLLTEVHPDEAVRQLADELTQRISKVRTERGLDRALYDVLDAAGEDGLDDTARRFRERALRDFRRAGVDRPEGDRERLRAVAERLTVLDQDFARHIREDVRSMRFTTEQLAGLPADFLAAHPPGEDGRHEITTDYPDYMPFRTFVRDPQARLELTREFLNRGWPVNDEILHEMVDLRDEQARLVGYHDWPSFDADVKMVGSAEAIAEFVARLADAAEPSGVRDRDVLLARRRRDEPDATTIDASNTAYYSELIRREDFDVDAQQTRRYFSFAKVRVGLLAVTARLFGVEYRPVDGPRWHADVTAYDVLRGGTRIGRIFLDLHPRPDKFKHAAQFDLVSGLTGRQLPEGVLVCNFSTGLMEHRDVVTLFHEFGHLLHHVLAGEQRWARFSGVATEWDFVEAPSQMLEEWAWDADVLRTFATDADGNPIPAELVAKMRAAQDFGKGMFVRNQLFYTALSFELHRDRPADITERACELQARYDLNAYVPDTHFHASFGHLAGYTSAYYTYLWSLVIAKDLFSAFDPADFFDAAVAERYRDTILAPGGRVDAADLVQRFLGRPFGFDAFAAWLDRAPVSGRT